MNDKKSNDEIVNSHIQMPKLLFKRFHNTNNKFFYYDVVGNYIGKNGTAESTNTELGYYSVDTENYFRDNIETPFGKIVSYVEKVGFEKERLSVESSIKDTVKNFLYALIARSPSLVRSMKEESNFIELLSTRGQHDYVARVGIGIAKEQKVFSEYIVTFLINRTDVPFVLSVDGMYNYSLNRHSVINLPISPSAAITLIHENYSSRVFHDDGAISMFDINERDKIMSMNEYAFTAQLKHNWGRVICPEREELNRLKEKYRK